MPTLSPTWSKSSERSARCKSLFCLGFALLITLSSILLLPKMVYAATIAPQEMHTYAEVWVETEPVVLVSSADTNASETIAPAGERRTEMLTNEAHEIVRMDAHCPGDDSKSTAPFPMHGWDHTMPSLTERALDSDDHMAKGCKP